MDSVSAGDGGPAEGHAAVMEPMDITTTSHDDSLTPLPPLASNRNGGDGDGSGGGAAHAARESEASLDEETRDRSSSLGLSRPDLDQSPSMPQRSMSNPVAMQSSLLRSAERWVNALVLIPFMYALCSCSCVCIDTHLDA